MGPVLESLIARITTVRRVSASGEPYVSKQELQQLIDRPIAIDILKECEVVGWRIPTIATTIRDLGLSTFATLIWVRMPELIVNLVDKQDLDNRLPFDENSQPELASSAPQFFDTQWTFLPVSLTLHGYQVLRSKEVIPFTSDIAKPHMDGSFGTMSQVSIEPMLQDLVPEAERKTAIFIKKMIRPRQNSSHAASVEFNCLASLRMLKHPNIVPLLNSFIQNDAFNFIFPCLDMDLETFLARDERFGSFVHDITLYRAIQGLASAIHSVHNFRIRGEVDIDLIMYHHDLRPANILVGPDTFLLADFGLSSTKPPEKGSKTEWKNTMGDYIAPECMNADFKSQSVGRGMDIWALGCLLVELATYMLQGTAGVEAAREARLRLVSDYWRVKNSYFWLGDAIRPEVSHHVAELQAYGNDGVSQLLDVATALLRVDTNGRLQSKDALEMTTNLTTRQVYAMAEESLGNFGDSLKNCGYAFPFALDIWMEKKKLRMWARALSLDSKQPRALLIDHRVEHSVIEHSQHILKDLDDLCETHGKQLRTLESGESKFSSSDCEPLYGTVCHEIHEKLQNLYNLLPPSTLRQLSQMSERDIIRTTDTQGFSSGDVDGLTSSDNQELASMALLRNLKDALEDLSLNDAETMSLRLEDSQLSGSSKVADGYHEIAWLQKQSSSATETSLSYRVLVERADFSRSWVKRTPEERAERIAALAKLLTRKKPAHLRVLNCLGYLAPNHEGYGLIFSFPPNQENAIPETLLGHLNQSVAKHGVKRATNKPALEARCQLALALARSIAELHSIHWLHKALNSNNILFFSSPAQFGIPDLSKPFIVDFRFSRPDGLSPFTDLSRDHPFADYVHPQYLEERKWYQGKRPTDTWTGMDDRNVGRFRQLYDYYSLGIILLELAYWTPIKTILKDHKTADPKEIPGILLKKYIPRLSGLIGRLYMEATKACIDGSINEWDDSFLGPESDDFYSKVIEPLAGIYVG